jgi:hypothetical protein
MDGDATTGEDLTRGASLAIVTSGTNTTANSKPASAKSMDMRFIVHLHTLNRYVQADVRASAALLAGV